MFFAYTLADNCKNQSRQWPEYSPVFQKSSKLTGNQDVTDNHQQTTAPRILHPCCHYRQGKDGRGGKKMDDMTRRPRQLVIHPNHRTSVRTTLC